MTKKTHKDVFAKPDVAYAIVQQHLIDWNRTGMFRTRQRYLYENKAYHQMMFKRERAKFLQAISLFNKQFAKRINKGMNNCSN